ncbi:MAG TPA: tryptophan synthase subunit alpha [Acidobacteriota bacterium]|nr:tryptophan synthase subunit alpha [Acidobacteriota bacterium]
MKAKFFPYMMIDFPSREFFLDLLDVAQGHADFIEIGIPFSDPLADGPIIQSAAHDVLQNGFDPEQIFNVLQKRKKKVPIALMTYANLVCNYGVEKFCKASADVDVQALIVPDVPHEESGQWREVASSSGLSWISFVSLFTKPKRLQEICRTARGFIYLVSVAGVTGTKISEVENVRAKAKQIKSFTDVPVALGFGIRSVQDAEPYGKEIDAFIVGTQIIKVIRETNSIREVEKLFTEFSGL